MEKEKLESLLIEYIDGNLSADDIRTVEQELAFNGDTRKLYEQLKEVLQATTESAVLIPSDALKSSFDQLLAKEIADKPKQRPAILIPMFYRIAAAVTLLMVAGTVGYWINKDQQYQHDLAVLKQEVERTKQAMMTMIDNEQSASQRMMGISVAYSLEKADDEIVLVLVNTMNEDPNSNVRMAALEALSKFHHEPEVRKALIESVKTQKDPVVQIALIQLLVMMKEKGVVKDLERMTKDRTLMKAVKDEAYSGIMKLS